jgi:hypothetical protein
MWWLRRSINRASRVHPLVQAGVVGSQQDRSIAALHRELRLLRGELGGARKQLQLVYNEAHALRVRDDRMRKSPAQAVSPQPPQPVMIPPGGIQLGSRLDALRSRSAPPTAQPTAANEVS